MSLLALWLEGCLNVSMTDEEKVRALRAAARLVINSWETGDLAEAVNVLQLVLEETEEDGQD